MHYKFGVCISKIWDIKVGEIAQQLRALSAVIVNQDSPPVSPGQTRRLTTIFDFISRASDTFLWHLQTPNHGVHIQTNRQTGIETYKIKRNQFSKRTWGRKYTRNGMADLETLCMDPYSKSAIPWWTKFLIHSTTKIYTAFYLYLKYYNSVN